jgi:hypothetical protein
MNHVPSHILEKILIDAQSVPALAAARGWRALKRPVVDRLAADIRSVADAAMVMAICTGEPSLQSVRALSPSVQGDKPLAMLMLKRSGGFDYDNLPAALADDGDVLQAMLTFSEGYAFGLIRDDTAGRWVPTAAGLMNLCAASPVEESLLLRAIIDDSWEDLPLYDDASGCWLGAS